MPTIMCGGGSLRGGASEISSVCCVCVDLHQLFKNLTCALLTNYLYSVYEVTRDLR